MTPSYRRTLLRAGAASAALTAAGRAASQSAEPWPARPIRLLVGFAPGGSSDVVARLLAQRLQPLLPQPVVVENRVGAGGLLAAEAVSKAGAPCSVSSLMAWAMPCILRLRSMMTMAPLAGL